MSKKLSIIKYIKNISRLPSEYQEVEYLESTGTQWISIPSFVPTNTSGFKIKCNKLSWTTLTHDEPILGSKQNDQRWWCGFDDNGIYIGFVSNVNRYPYTLGTDVIIENNYLNDRTKKINGEVKEQITETITATLNSLTVFRFISTSSEITVSGRICYLEITNNNQLVHNLIPCYRKSDSVAGMYDLITNTFYTNQGTGSFILGPSIAKVCESILCNIKQNGHNLPSQYQEVEYLEATGNGTIASTRYNINTGISGSLDTEIETNIKHISAQTSLYKLFTPYSSNKSQSSTGIALSYYDSGPAWAIKFGSGSWKNGGAINLDVWHSIVHNKDYCIIDGNSISIQSTSLTDTSNIYILCDLWNFAIPSNTKLQMKNFIIKKSNSVVFNGIPCYRKSDSVAGMYDLVTNTFFTNQGTGTFSVGADVKNKIKYCIVEREVTE